MSENEIPEFEDVIKAAIRAGAIDLHVSMPGKIDTYNYEYQRADVKPLLKKEYLKDKEVVSLPVIPSVPVQFPSANGGNARMTFPIKEGDLGTLIFYDRSVEDWLSGDGSEVLPKEFRLHDLTDAIFIPGVSTEKNKLTIENEDDVFIVNSDSKIQLSPDGTILIENSDSKIKINQNGDIDIESSGKTNINAVGDVEIQAPNIKGIAATKAEITAPVIAITGITTLTGNVTIVGNLQVNGTINATGSIIDAATNTNHHSHP